MILISGFPGFLATFLIQDLKKVLPANKEISVLVEKHFVKEAKLKLEQMGLNKVNVLEGDISKKNLGLNIEIKNITKFYHLAAIYDLGVSRDLAYKVNVEGTKNVIDFCKNQNQFESLEYVSTCYVSGRFQGHFFESYLSKGQNFNNYYEETKYLAEIEVHNAIADGLKARIYRPGIIVGSSKDGFTVKFDGPYYIFQWILRNNNLVLLPKLGNSSKILTNIVPVDYVSNAIANLSVQTFSQNKIYHLSDPNPTSVDKLLKLAEKIVDKKILSLYMPERIVKWSLKNIKPISSFMKIKPDIIDYFTHPTIYDSSQAREDLAKLDIYFPKVEAFLPKIIEYQKQSLLDLR